MYLNETPEAKLLRERKERLTIDINSILAREFETVIKMEDAVVRWLSFAFPGHR